MRHIFLGRWWHWGILIAITALLWFAGSKRMHVVEFNTFIVVLLAGLAVVIAIVLAGTRPGEQVTRDKLEPGQQD